MKRFTALALAIALIVPFGLVGCGEEASTTVTQDTPSGTTTQTVETETTGENPPAPVGDVPTP